MFYSTLDYQMDVFDFSKAREGTRNEEMMEVMRENYPVEGHLKRVIAMHNSNFAHAEDTPTGTLAIYDTAAPVHPDSIPENAFEWIAVCPIKDTPLMQERCNDAYFTAEEQRAELDKQVVQFATDPGPPQLHNRLQGAVHDTEKYWQPELGQHGFAGIFKKLSPDHRTFKYYVAAQSGAPVVASQFKSYISQKEPPLTFGEMLQDQNYIYTQGVARRNTLRLAYQVARAMRVEIDNGPDYMARTPSPNLCKACVAIPPQNYLQPVSTIGYVSHDGKQCVGVYHKCKPGKLCSEIALVSASPQEGIIQFNMKQNVQSPVIPSTVGVRNERVEPIAGGLSKSVTRGLQWEGDAVWNPVLHSDYYNHVDDEMLQKMTELGWEQTGVDNRSIFTPVQVKISNPELRRP